MSWRPPGREHPGEETEDAEEEHDADGLVYIVSYDVHWITPIVYNIICEWQAEHRGQSWITMALDANAMALEALNQFEDTYEGGICLSSNTIGAAIDQYGARRYQERQEVTMDIERSTTECLELMSQILYDTHQSAQQPPSAPSTPEQATRKIASLTPERESLRENYRTPRCCCPGRCGLRTGGKCSCRRQMRCRWQRCTTRVRWWVHCFQGWLQPGSQQH